MKTILITLLFSLTQFIYADKALDRAVILVELTNTFEISDTQIALMEKQLSPLKAQYTEIQYEYILTEFKKLLQTVMQSPEVKIELAKVHQSHFSEEEIEQLIVAFESPVYKKFFKFKTGLDVEKEKTLEKILNKKSDTHISQILSEALKK